MINWMRGFEITNTELHRNGGAEEQQRPAVTIAGTGSRMITVIMHDIGHAAPGPFAQLHRREARRR